MWDFSWFGLQGHRGDPSKHGLPLNAFTTYLGKSKVPLVSKDRLVRARTSQLRVCGGEGHVDRGEFGKRGPAVSNWRTEGSELCFPWERPKKKEKKKQALECGVPASAVALWDPNSGCSRRILVESGFSLQTQIFPDLLPQRALALCWERTALPGTRHFCQLHRAITKKILWRFCRAEGDWGVGEGKLVWRAICKGIFINFDSRGHRRKTGELQSFSSRWRTSVPNNR